LTKTESEQLENGRACACSRPAVQAGKFEGAAEAAAEALQKSGQMMSSEAQVAKLLSRRSEVRDVIVPEIIRHCYQLLKISLQTDSNVAA